MSQEKFKTTIGGQALIEGIMMRGPDKDAIVVRAKEGLHIETMPRKKNPPKSWKNLPFIRGIFNFFDAQVVGITYEINRWAGRNDNGFTRILTAPGMWLQNFTTNEPDDSMIEVGIAAVEAVLPEQEGADRW